MKKLLLTVGLSALTLGSALAQGTVAFGNSASSAIQYNTPTLRDTTAADMMEWNAAVSVYFGPAGSGPHELVQAPGLGYIGSNPGVIATVDGNSKDRFAIPGTSGGDVVSLEIRMINRTTGEMYGRTGVRQVTLGDPRGPGTVVWQGASGTDPNRFKPLIWPVPEPSTLALGALGLALSLVGARRRMAK